LRFDRGKAGAAFRATDSAGLDEVSYLALDPVQASLLFQVIANRKASRSSSPATKTFSEWGDVFGYPE